MRRPLYEGPSRGYEARLTSAAPLNDRTLRHHRRRVSVPDYDRRALTPAVVHLSVGGFHRSHQAVYLDDLARLGHTGWGLTGVGLRRRDMARALWPQDHLYTVVERGAGDDRARIVGVMGRYLFAPDDPQAVVDALADERTRLVTMTITGAGYRVSDSAALGLLVDALDVRRRTRRPALTVLSCDNMPANGEVTRQAVVALADRRDERLARWVEEHVAFPNGMVDRITPKTTDSDRTRVAAQFGVADRWPVMTEPFSEWVIEDEFALERPPLDEVGVRFVRDVRPYSLTKTRLLNASHLILGSLGRLAGLATMDQVMADAAFETYAEQLMETEIGPSLPRSGFALTVYRRSLLERLANPKMRDQVARLCRGTSVKFPRHVLPSVLAARDDGRPLPLLTLAVAATCRQLRGIDDLGRPFSLDDPAADRLQPLALAGGTDPRPLLAETDVFGPLGEDEELVLEVERMLESFEHHGTRATVARALASDGLVPA